MAGAALSRLWDTHPRLAFALHLLATLFFGGFALRFFVTRDLAGGLVLGVLSVVMAATLVLFTRLAMQNDWRPDDTSYDGRGQVVSPRAAWSNTRGAGRALWVLFALAFVPGLALAFGRNLLGVALVLVAFVIAIVAMRMD
jgi:hypothetical protein